MDPIDRRSFLKMSAASAGAALAANRLLEAQTSTPAAAVPTKPSTMVGMATSVAPLVRSDLDPLLGDMAAHAGVNALFPFIYTHVANRAGAPAGGFHGGNYATTHLKYYADTNLTLEDMRAPEFGGVDVLARLIPAARRHGMKTFAWVLEDNVRGPGPRWEALYEVDFHGRRATRHPGGPCNNHPQYRGYLRGLLEDYMRSYEIDGIMWGSERQGGLLNALGAFHNGERTDPGTATCFCEYCLRRAKTEGIDAERARRGFVELEKFVLAGRANQRPRDGWFVSFWRLLVGWPELLAWENLWVRSRHELQAELYQHVKSINSAMPVGWHLWHNLSFSPFHRAEEDYAALAPFSDYIKPVLYNNCGGERLKSFTDSVCGNVFGDLAPASAMEFMDAALNYHEAPYPRIAATGLSPDYVQRETRRAVDALAGTPVQVWSGIDIDAPVGAGSSHCTPDSVRLAVRAIFQGGGRGAMLSRNYTEMKPENLAGAGLALRELGLL
jgi:hypothetical protein